MTAKRATTPPVPAKRKAAPKATKKGKPGRPTSLTPEVQKRICDAIRAGNYLEAAAAYAGVSTETVRLWLIRGKDEGSGIYWDFCTAYAKAEADSEVSLVADWRAGAKKDWRASRDLLARRFPDRWKEQQAVDHTTAGQRIGGITITDVTVTRTAAPDGDG